MRYRLFCCWVCSFASLRGALFDQVVNAALDAATYIGGSEDDTLYRIAVDRDGHVFAVGHTDSTNYPTTPGAYDRTKRAYADIVVSKFSADLTQLLASTYIGGDSFDWGFAIAVDATGNVYVTGVSYSSDYPTTVGAYDRIHNGGRDMVLCKFDASLQNLQASTFVGGNGADYPHALAFDVNGNVCVCGTSGSTNCRVDERATASLTMR